MRFGLGSPVGDELQQTGHHGETCAKDDAGNFCEPVYTLIYLREESERRETSLHTPTVRSERL